MAVKSADQITIVDVTDAYSVGLTSETYTFVGGTSGAASGQTCTTKAYAYCGSNQCDVVNVNAGDITCPTGVSVEVSNSGSPTPTITFKLTAALTAACEATIPVVVDGITIYKKFSFAVAKAGNNGTSITIKSTSVTYVKSTSGTTTPTSGWQEDIPTVGQGEYLWTKTVVTYSDNTSTTSYSVSRNATNGTNGTSVTVRSTSVTYVKSTSGTTTPTSGWDPSIPTVGEGEYLWTKTVVTYSDGKSTTAYSVSRNAVNGENGADAITLTITASNGTVFKNNSGSTVLTAHVYKGGVEQSITDAGVCGSLGTIKWYNGSGTQPSGWPKTSKTITAGASSGSGIDVVVSNATAITCQLEK